MPTPTPSELREFIDDALRDKLRVLRNARARRKQKMRTVAFILIFIFLPATCIVTWVVGADGFTGRFDMAATLWVPLLMLALFAAIYIPIHLWVHREDLPFEYKEDVVTPLIHFLDPRLRSRPTSQFPTDLLDESRFFDSSADHLRCTDYFNGTVRSMEFHLANLEISTESDVFRGLFAAVRYPFEFDSPTVVSSTYGGDELPNPSQWADLEPGDVDDAPEEFRLYFRRGESGCPSLRQSNAEQIFLRFRDYAESRYRTPFVASLNANQLSIAVARPLYFDRPRTRPKTSITDTTHLHRIGEELSLVIDVIELIERRRGPTG